MNRGVPPTPRNARTGLLTPPGITFRARSNMAVDCGYLSFIRSSGSWFVLMGESDRAGHSLQTSCEKSSVCGMIHVTPDQPKILGQYLCHRATESQRIEDRGSKIEDRRSSNALRSSILDPRSSILCASVASSRGQF